MKGNILKSLCAVAMVVFPLLEGRASLAAPLAWSSTGSMSAQRYSHSTVLLPTGGVLACGGYSTSGQITNSCELYNPDSGTWSAALPMATARAWHTMTVLPNAKVLVAGGLGASGVALSSAELYDINSGQWGQAGSMTGARYWHTATLMRSGKVLVAAGYNGSLSISTCEIYDPVANTWAAAEGLSTPRYYHAAAMLSDGKVLVSGGYLGGNSYLTTCNVYNPQTGKWGNAAALNRARYRHTATLLPGGDVLITGGIGGSGSESLASCELYDHVTKQWTEIAALGTGRHYHTATLLPNGKVLISGGISGGTGQTLSSAEMFNPAAGTWAGPYNMISTRRYHTATLLPNGYLLVSGGHSGTAILKTAELFQPEAGVYAEGKPAVTASPAAVMPGDGLNLEGEKFCGISEASGGNCSFNSVTAFPIVSLTRVSNGVKYPCVVLSWTQDGASVSCGTPLNAPYAQYNLVVTANAVQSDPVTIYLGYPNGNACQGNWQCIGGICADGRCCDSTCPGLCKSCDVPGKEGACSFMEDGEDPDIECGGVDGTCVGKCNGSGACRWPGAEKVCGNCKACNGAGRCVLAAEEVSCDDLDVCTRDDECANDGTCAGEPVVCDSPPASQCYVSPGRCEQGEGCRYDFSPDTEECDDDAPCTRDDKCDGAGGCAGEPVVCESPPNSMCYDLDGSCVEGDCVYVRKDAGSGCDDGDACTVDDTCDENANCVVKQKECLSPPDVQCHEPEGICSVGNCVYLEREDGTECDDADPCTAGDGCSAGTCEGVPMECGSPPNAQCYSAEGSCVGGACVYVQRPLGSGCDDGDPCTTGDSCTAQGQCIGSPVVCAQPPEGFCYEDSGICEDGLCRYIPRQPFSPCDDADPCTVDDGCDGIGGCEGAPATCDSPPGPCFEPEGTCENAECVYTPGNIGALCDDTDPCTENDLCEEGGACKGRAVQCVSPPEGLQCISPEGRCVEGECRYSFAQAGTSCNDADPCTVQDACTAEGRCAGAPMQCDEPPNRQCYSLEGYCDEGRCRYNMREAGSSCSDGDDCTENDACDWNGNCAGEPREDCAAPDAGAGDAAGRPGRKSGYGCSCGLAGGEGGMVAFLPFGIIGLLALGSRRKKRNFFSPSNSLL